MSWLFGWGIQILISWFGLLGLVEPNKRKNNHQIICPLFELIWWLCDDYLIDYLIDYLLDYLLDYLINYLINYLIDYLTDYLWLLDQIINVK